MCWFNPNPPVSSQGRNTQGDENAAGVDVPEQEVPLHRLWLSPATLLAKPEDTGLERGETSEIKSKVCLIAEALAGGCVSGVCVGCVCVCISVLQEDPQGSCLAV